MLVVPIGGGGLISGIAVAAKALKPDDRDHRRRGRALPVDVDRRCVARARARRRPDPRRGHRGQGAGHADPADRPRWSPTSSSSTRRCSSARSSLLDAQKLVVEGAGAAGSPRCSPRRSVSRPAVGIVICGGNIDARLLASILMRGLVRGGRIVSFRLTIPDRPGILGQRNPLFGRFNANILAVDHHRLFLDVPAKGAKLDVTIETRDAAHAEEIFAALAGRLPPGAHAERQGAGVERVRPGRLLLLGLLLRRLLLEDAADPFERACAARAPNRLRRQRPAAAAAPGRSVAPRRDCAADGAGAGPDRSAGRRREAYPPPRPSVVAASARSSPGLPAPMHWVHPASRRPPPAELRPPALGARPRRPSARRRSR